MSSADKLAAGRQAMARLSEGLYLLSRFHPPRSYGAEGGRQWERWIAHDLLPRGTTVCQGPGALHLFGGATLSGFRHELDGASRATWGDVMIEAKAYGSCGPS